MFVSQQTTSIFFWLKQGLSCTSKFVVLHSFFKNLCLNQLLTMFAKPFSTQCRYYEKSQYSNVSVKSKLQHAPPGQPPGHLTFLKMIVQIPPYPGQNAVQMPHTGVHSGDQMPPPRGHFKGTKMTEGRQKRLRLSNKIFINITKTEKHC